MLINHMILEIVNWNGNGPEASAIQGGGYVYTIQ